MANHTPGPWHVGEPQSFHANRIWTNDMQPIAGLLSFGSRPPDLDPTAQANARLIAAAPVLLDALRKLTLEVGGMMINWEPEIRAAAGNTNYAVTLQRYNEAVDAIAKATGA